MRLIGWSCKCSNTFRWPILTVRGFDLKNEYKYSWSTKHSKRLSKHYVVFVFQNISKRHPKGCLFCCFTKENGQVAYQEEKIFLSEKVFLLGGWHKGNTISKSFKRMIYFGQKYTVYLRKLIFHIMVNYLFGKKWNDIISRNKHTLRSI